MRAIDLCRDCGAVLGYCQECGEYAECGYCAAGLVPPQRRRLAIERRPIRSPQVTRRRRRAPGQEDAPPILERMTGLSGDHLAMLGLSAIAALARSAGGPGVRVGQVVDGEWREVR
jgi:hypothetical protein